MGLKDVSGVFSREFIVGYFAPSFFALVVLVWALEAPPKALSDPLEGAGLLLLGAVALLVALVLNGLRHPITSVYAGNAWRNVFGLGSAHTEFSKKTLDRRAHPLAEQLERRLHAQFGVLQRVIAKGGRNGDAAKKIRDVRLGEDKHAIAPTRFGSARAAAGSYAKSRWGIDLWYAWPRIAPLIPEPEAALRRDAETDQAFFLNGAVLTLLGAAALAVIEVVGDNTVWLKALVLALLALAGHWMLYRFAVQAAERAGTHARASLDLHYPELLRRLGASGDLVAASAELHGFWADGVRPEWLEPVPDAAHAQRDSGGE